MVKCHCKKITVKQQATGNFSQLFRCHLYHELKRFPELVDTVWNYRLSYAYILVTGLDEF